MKDSHVVKRRREKEIRFTSGAQDTAEDAHATKRSAMSGSLPLPLQPIVKSSSNAYPGSSRGLGAAAGDGGSAVSRQLPAYAGETTVHPSSSLVELSRTSLLAEPHPGGNAASGSGSGVHNSSSSTCQRVADDAASAAAVADSYDVCAPLGIPVAADLQNTTAADSGSSSGVYASPSREELEGVCHAVIDMNDIDFTTVGSHHANRAAGRDRRIVPPWPTHPNRQPRRQRHCGGGGAAGSGSVYGPPGSFGRRGGSDGKSHGNSASEASRWRAQTGTNPLTSSRRTSLSSVNSVASSVATTLQAPVRTRSGARPVSATSTGTSAPPASMIPLLQGTLGEIAPTAAAASLANTTLGTTAETATLLPITAFYLRAMDAAASGATTAGATAVAAYGGRNVDSQNVNPEGSAEPRRRAAALGRQPMWSRIDGSCYTHNIDQARESQVQMRHFEGVLRGMQEEARRVRRRAGGGGMNDRIELPDPQTLVQGLCESQAAEAICDDDGGHGCFEDEEDVFDSQNDGVAVKSSRRIAAGDIDGSRQVSPSLQLRALQRRLAVAERFMRDHPELDATLREEVNASETRMATVRTIRKSVGFGKMTTVAYQDALEITDAPVVKESVDWTGHATACSEANVSGSNALAEGESRALNSTMAQETRVAAETSSACLADAASPRGVGSGSDAREGTLALSAAAAVVDVPALSESLRGLPVEDLLAELLERGKGRSVYGAERNGCSPARGTKRPSVKKRLVVTARARAAAGTLQRKDYNAASPTVAAADLGRCAAPTGATTPRKVGATVVSTTTSPADIRVTFLPATSSVSPPKAGAGNLAATTATITALCSPKPSLAVASSLPAAKKEKTPLSKPQLKATVKATPPRAVREALPATLGVGDRSAAVLQCEVAQTRLATLEARMTLAKDARRTFELLRQLQPMRAALLERDATGLYEVAHPSEWTRKYPTRRSGHQGKAEQEKGRDSGCVNGDALVLPPIGEHRGEMSAQAQAAAVVDSHGVVKSVAAITANAEPLTLASQQQQQQRSRRIFESPQETLERHRQEIFATALKLDDAQRRTSLLFYVDVLEDVSRRQVPAAMWPAVSAALQDARGVVSEGTRDRQSYAGFQSLAQDHFSAVELVQWPVQQVLGRLAALFQLTPREYQEWLANLYQQLSTSHNYEARFRAVDRTVKDRDIPDEAHVRVVLHTCRRLPRSQPVLSPSTTGVMRSDDHSTSGGGRGNHASSTYQVRDEGEMRSVARDGSPVVQAAPLPPGAALGRGEASPLHGMESPPLGPSAAPSGTSAGSRDATSPLSTTLGTHHSPQIPKASPLTAAPAVGGEATYAIRVDAEQLSMTSAAMPAVAARQSGAEKTKPGACSPRCNATASAAGGGGGAGGSASAADRAVNFHDQTFKLHLYDVNSPIRVTLLRDGQPVAEGTLSAHRHGGGRRSQLWLPLTAVNGGGGSGTLPAGGPHASRKTEIRMTVELL